MSKSKLPRAVYDALNEHSFHVDEIGIKLRSLGLLLMGQEKESMEHEGLLSGIGIILVGLSNDLELLAERLDPVELGKQSKRKSK